MLADRMHHKRQPPEAGEPLRQRVESSLAQVEHQVWLLRNVHWWCLLPFAVSCLAFIGQVTWQERSGGWWMALAASIVVAIVVIVLAGVYWLNLYAVRCSLDPWRRELETLLTSLKDETTAAS
jgi:membrane protein YdbS with pleckstrin-like domain